jgi:hypothetical protein
MTVPAQWVHPHQNHSMAQLAMQLHFDWIKLGPTSWKKNDESSSSDHPYFDFVEILTIISQPPRD